MNCFSYILAVLSPLSWFAQLQDRNCSPRCLKLNIAVVPDCVPRALFIVTVSLWIAYVAPVAIKRGISKSLRDIEPNPPAGRFMVKTLRQYCVFNLVFPHLFYVQWGVLNWTNNKYAGRLFFYSPMLRIQMIKAVIIAFFLLKSKQTAEALQDSNTHGTCPRYFAPFAVCTF